MTENVLLFGLDASIGCKLEKKNDSLIYVSKRQLANLKFPLGV